MIRALAGAQRGRLSRRQLIALGVAEGAVDRRIASGLLVPVHAGVYAIGGAPAAELAEETAALLACGPRAWLSHHSAAVLWELRPGVARPVHVTVPVGSHHRHHAGVTVHRSRILESEDVLTKHGLPVLSPARTLLDLAATSLTDRDIERLVHEAVYVRGLTSIGRLQRLIRRSGRHAGVRTLRRVLKHPEQLKRTGSNPEERLLELIRRAGLPEPRAQVHVLGHPVDFMWPELKLAVEVDTYGTHGSPARFERDRRLDAEILAATGISVLRVTDERIEHEPLAVAATLAATVAARRHGQFRAVDAG